MSKTLHKLVFTANEMKWNSLSFWSFDLLSLLLWTIQMRRCFLSYKVSVDITFTTQNEILFLSKWPEWNNSHNELPLWLFHVNSYKWLRRHWIENISFCKKWNLLLSSDNEDKINLLVLQNVYSLKTRLICYCHKI